MSGRCSYVDRVNPGAGKGNDLVATWEKVLVTSGYIEIMLKNMKIRAVNETIPPL